MSDVLPPIEVDETESENRTVTRPRSRMMNDPVVRRMAYLAAGLVIVFLLVVVTALLTGVATPSGPRTLAEREVAVAGAAVQAGSTDTAVWGQYIAALIADKQYGRAKDFIAQGRESLDDSKTAEFSLAEARLYSAQKQYKKAIEAAEKTKKQVKDAFDARIAQGGMAKKAAELEGISSNYYDAILVEAGAYRSLEDWANAIAQYDLYIEGNGGASDILVDRANVKIESGDIAGAEKDFNEALRFVPDDPEALAGLKKIGVSK